MEKQTINIDTIVLNSGSHNHPHDGHCLLEVVSMFSGEKFGDAPACVDPILAAFGRNWNDGMRSDEERAQLKQYIARLPGTLPGPLPGPLPGTLPGTLPGPLPRRHWNLPSPRSKYRRTSCSRA